MGEAEIVNRIGFPLGRAGPHIPRTGLDGHAFPTRVLFSHGPKFPGRMPPSHKAPHQIGSQLKPVKK